MGHGRKDCIMKRPKDYNGYHIAQSAMSPSPLYLGQNGKFVHRPDAVLFYTPQDAQKYAEEVGLVLGANYNVVVLCDCPKFERDRHPRSPYPNTKDD